MKTITEILDEVADFEGYTASNGYALGYEISRMINKAAEIYANQSRWISVEDRLPEIGVRVLIYNIPCQDIYMAELTESGYFTEDNTIRGIFCRGDYWQTLPKSPPIHPPKH